MRYHLERRDGSVWVSVGSYGSEQAAYDQLAAKSKVRSGMWRIVCRGQGHTEVIVVVST